MSSITGNNRVRDELRIVCKKRRTRTGIECLVRKTLHRHMCYAFKLPIDDLYILEVSYRTGFCHVLSQVRKKKSLRVAEPAKN